MEQAITNSSPITRRPLPWICGALTVGILWDAFSGNSLLWTLWTFWTLLAGFLICALISLFSRRPHWLYGAVLLLAVLLGGIRYQSAVLIPLSDVSRQAPMAARLTGVVDSEVEAAYAAPEEHYQRIRLRLHAETLGPHYRSLDDNLAPKQVTGEIEVSLPLMRSISASAIENRPHYEDRPHYGDRVELAGSLEIPEGARNPGGFDDRAALARRGIHARLTVRRPEDWRLLSNSNTVPYALNRLAYALKHEVVEHNHRAFSPVRAGTLDALLMGAKEALPPEVQEAFARTGTAHLLGTSGLHVGLVAGMLLFLLPLLPIARRPALLLTLAGLILYTLMTGGRASVARAVIVTAVYVIGMALEREPDLPGALSLAAAGLLLANPCELFEPGFQITFATAFTLVLGMPLIQPLLRRWKARIHKDRPESKLLHWLGEYLIVCFLLTLLAQLGSLPLIAAYFNSVSLVGILANTLVIPIIAPLIALGFAAAALNAVSPVLSLPCDWLLNALTAYILKVVEVGATLPSASYSVQSPSPVLICLYYGAVWWALWRLRKRTRSGKR